MFSWLANAWRVPELRHRVLFTALILAIYRLGSWIPAPGVDSDDDRQLFQRPRRHDPRPAQPLLGRRALAVLDLRARDHAVHHRLDHPPADDRGDPEARRAAEGGRVGLRQDQPVHALPDRRARRGPVDRLRVPLPPPGRARRRPRPDDADHPHAHRRLHAADVDGRADHQARDRQRHLAPDLRLDPHQRSAGRRRLVERRADGEALLPADRPLGRRLGRLHPGGPAPDPDPVRQADGRPPHDRGRIDLHAAAREHGRRHPGHLRGRR